MNEQKFIIRVYGILLDKKLGLLVSDERIHGMEVVKLPGGGLEFGEGIADCLLRECVEEGIGKVEILKHFYTTDFFQESAFNKNHQIVSIYYLISSPDISRIPVSNKKFDFKTEEADEECFRWMPIEKISEQEFTLPIDKVVGEKIQAMWKASV